MTVYVLKFKVRHATTITTITPPPPPPLLIVGVKYVQQQKNEFLKYIKTTCKTYIEVGIFIAEELRPPMLYALFQLSTELLAS